MSRHVGVDIGTSSIRVTYDSQTNELPIGTHRGNLSLSRQCQFTNHYCNCYHPDMILLLYQPPAPLSLREREMDI